MSNTTELNMAVAELNKKLEELQGVFNGYRAFVASASKSMHESIGIFLDKIQEVVEMAYTKNSNFKSLEKTSNKDDCSFPRLSKVGAKDQVSRNT